MIVNTALKKVKSLSLNFQKLFDQGAGRLVELQVGAWLEVYEVLGEIEAAKHPPDGATSAVVGLCPQLLLMILSARKLDVVVEPDQVYDVLVIFFFWHENVVCSPQIFVISKSMDVIRFNALLPPHFISFLSY